MIAARKQERSMRRHSSFLSCLLIAVSAFAQQPQTVNVKIHAVLVDRDLNQKPVPHLELTITSLGNASGAPISARTALDGTAQVELAPGKYKLVSVKPLDFQGKSYSWEIEIAAATGAVIELSNDNAKTLASSIDSAAIDPLAEQFKRLKETVVTVWAQDGLGSGFLIDVGLGLFVTNHHVIADSPYLAVQFDPRTKVIADLVADDKENDLAVVRVNPDAVKGKAAVTLADAGARVVEGQRIFTIGNPFGKEKVLTTGIVSKVDAKNIISDINFNSGNSGGPLFDTRGVVVGVAAFVRSGEAGPGLAGIVPIAKATELIAKARATASGKSGPSARLLPVAPTEKYVGADLREISKQSMPRQLYVMSVGEFDVELITPVVRYWAHQQRLEKLQKEQAKRAKKAGAAPPEAPSQPEPEYEAVVTVDVSPKIKLGFWKLDIKFRDDFTRLRLLCGEKEVEPILPGRYPLRPDPESRVRLNDTSWEGFYQYPLDAISPSCGTVTLQVFSTREGANGISKALSPESVQRVYSDFEPYRRKNTTTASAK
jgi:S1-C subfamily serine protease